MKIVYFNPVGIMGGAERCLLNCMVAMRRAQPGYDLHLLAGGEGSLPAATREAGLGVTLLPMPLAMAELGESVLTRRQGSASSRLAAALRLGGRAAAALPATRQYVARLRAALRALGPDLIHSNGLKGHLLTYLAGPGLGPVVWHLHDFIGARPAMGRALRWASGRTAGVVAISRAVAADAAAALPGTPVRVVYNGIDVGCYRPAPASDDDAPGGAGLDLLAGMAPAPAGALRVGLVATFARWKGQDLLLDAAARLLNGPDAEPGRGVRFFIVGGPIYQTRGSQFSEVELRAKAAALGIAARVGFIAFQPRTEAIYRALDVVVHASTRPEPFGLTIAEAMACGRPLIVARAGGAAELFTHDHDALGFPPGDAPALAAAVARLVGDPALRRRLGDNAARTAARRFGRDRLGPQMLAAYRGFLAGDPEGSTTEA